ncbi:MAG: type IIL restriction-modification enzyme MmeI [Thermoguttaceae bacterium]
MPSELVRAHSMLDNYVDKLYKKEGFKDEVARVSHLFVMYDRLTSND